MSQVFLPENEIDIFADYLNVKEDISLTFYYVNLMLPLFVAIIIANISIGYFFPTFKNVYSQGTPSSFAINLKVVRTFLNFIVYFFALIFIYLLPLMKVGEAIGRGSYTGVYNNLLPLIILNLVLLSIYLLANSFTKFNYLTEGGFFYCAIVKGSDDNTDDSTSTCERTNWQTSRDALLCSISDFVSNMSVFFSTGLSDTFGPLLPFLIFGSVILGGIFKHVYSK
jgi:hypothetical protein